MKKHTIGYLRVEASWLRRAILTLFDVAAAQASELEDNASGAWHVMTADAFADLPERELQRRANQLKAYAAQAAVRAVDLAIEAGRLHAFVSMRIAEQPDGLLR